MGGKTRKKKDRHGRGGGYAHDNDFTTFSFFFFGYICMSTIGQRSKELVKSEELLCGCQMTV